MHNENTPHTTALDAAAPMAGNIEITASAADRIAVLRSEENNPDLMLRITVLGGGCSGFQYSMEFDDQTDPHDAVFERSGVKVVTDDVSLRYLAGAQIDYVSDLMGSSFVIKNPNAKSSCGCGNSFAPNM